MRSPTGRLTRGSLVAAALAGCLTVVLGGASLWWAGREDLPGEPGGPSDRPIVDAAGELVDDARSPAPVDLDPVSEDALTRGASAVSVTLLDHEGGPVADALTRLLLGHRSKALATDPDGVAEFVDIADGAYVLHVETGSRPRLVTAGRLVVGENERLEVTCVLEPFDLVIAGRVVDDEGDAVPGVRILARRVISAAGASDLVPFDEATQTAQTAADGFFELVGLDRGDHELRVSGSPEHATSDHVVRAGTLDVEIILVTGRAVRVHGVVTDAQERPVSGAQVSTPDRRHLRDVADHRGEYELRRVVRDDERVSVVARAAGYRVARRTIDPEEHPDGLEWKIDLRLDPEEGRAWIAGAIHADSGEPLPATRVEVHSPESDTLRTVLSGADGRFEVRDLPAGDDYEVRVRPRRRFADWRRRPVSVDEDGVDLEIRLRTLLRGRLEAVVVDTAGEPVSNWAFRLRSAVAAAHQATGRTSQTGSFTLEDVPAGEMILESRSPPLVVVRGVTLDPDSDRHARFAVDLGSHELGGSVLDARGAPLTGCSVELTWSPSRSGSPGGCLRTTRTGRNGRFLFRGVGGGERRIRALRGKAASPELPVDPATASSPLELRLPAAD